MPSGYDLTAVLSTQLDAANSTKFAAANCVDGGTGPGDSGQVACSTDGGDPSPRLDVTFPCDSRTSVGALSKVEVFNRAGCCQDWLTLYQLQLIDADGTTVARAFLFNTTQANYTFAGERFVRLRSFG